jgi:hypothetical protein
LSSGDSGGVDFSATLRDEGVDLSGEVTLQGSNGVEFGMPFCLGPSLGPGYGRTSVKHAPRKRLP